MRFKRQLPITLIVLGVILLVAFFTGQTPDEILDSVLPIPTTSPTQHFISVTPQVLPDKTKSNISSPILSPGDANLFFVNRVIDGDTIEVTSQNVSEKVRMIGINSPESVDPRRKVECFGKEASAHLKTLIENKAVWLEGDDTQQERDRYGRLLRFVFLDGVNINEQMILDGFAFEYTYEDPYKYQSSFIVAQQDAQDNKRGLWADTTCQGKK